MVGLVSIRLLFFALESRFEMVLYCFDSDYGITKALMPTLKFTASLVRFDSSNNRGAF